MLAERVRLAERKAAGIVDRFDEQRRRPIEEHLEDFERHLKAREVSREQVKLVMYRARRIIKGCRAAYVSELTAGRVQAFLADLREGGISIQTSNHYLRAIKQFTRWLLRERRTGEDSLAFISMLNVATDRRHDRRPLTHEELNRLLDATHRGVRVFSMDADDRAMLYAVAAYTGLRAGELASLTTDSFRLDDSPPTVTVQAAYSKRRREDVLPLHAGLVERVRPWVTAKDQGSALWPGTWARYHFAGRMLQHDLKSAGIPYVDPDGRYADFHALRHTFITNLMKSGVNPKTAQSLARHSTIELTMNVYTSLTVHDQAAALASLPAPPILVAEAAFKATGTDGPKMVPTMVPRSAKNGAERLASAPQDLAPDCTQNGRRQRPRRSSQSSSKRGKKAHSRSSTQQSASSCEAERARFELAVPVRALRFSRPVHSAALPPLRRVASIADFGSVSSL